MAVMDPDPFGLTSHTWVTKTTKTITTNTANPKSYPQPYTPPGHSYPEVDKSWDRDAAMPEGHAHPLYKHLQSKKIFEAEQVPDDADKLSELARWVGARVFRDTGLRVPTLEGVEAAFIGDWVVRDEDGIVYVYTNEDFNSDFEPRLL